MTIEEKARAYDEALEDMRVIYPNLKGDAKLAVEHAFPQLRESEDERIRKWLIYYFSSIKETVWIHRDITCEQILAYLEKQKTRMKPIYDARESFESALEKAWNDYHNGYENVDRLEDDYVECAHAKGFREGYLFGIEKRKPIGGIYWHAIKKGEKLPCRAYIWNPDYEKYHDCWEGRLIPNLEKIHVGADTWYLPAKDVRDLPREGVDELPKEQKPAEKQDYSGLTDLERAILRGFLAAGVENVPVGIIKETAQECLEQMKPAEWSEEDEFFRQQLIVYCEKGIQDPLASKCVDWLKSLRPSWKPSDQDELMKLKYAGTSTKLD